MTWTPVIVAFLLGLGAAQACREIKLALQRRRLKRLICSLDLDVPLPGRIVYHADDPNRQEPLS